VAAACDQWAHLWCGANLDFAKVHYSRVIEVDEHDHAGFRCDAPRSVFLARPGQTAAPNMIASRRSARVTDLPSTSRSVMQRIAVPMIGGMISSTILTLVVIPAVYGVIKGWRLPAVTAHQFPDVERASEAADQVS
jgi:Cu(I)/Ag(I) efflux system membrane protein CusA/SilA